MNSTTTLLQPLAARLKACPARDDRISQRQLVETWDKLKQVTPEHGDAVTPALVAGVILHDPEAFAPLLNEAEHEQLQALGRAALERYLERTRPPNKLGKILAATLEKLT